MSGVPSRDVVELLLPEDHTVRPTPWVALTGCDERFVLAWRDLLRHHRPEHGCTMGGVVPHCKGLFAGAPRSLNPFGG